jgi:predicted glycosyltransferase
MADSPKVIEEKYNRILNAWKTLAPDKTFGGMTLAQFEAQIAKSNAPRVKIESLDDELKQEQANRETEDTQTLKACDTVVKNVVADPTFGDDSALYEAMGYVRKSNRKSGLTRKKTKNEPGNP